MTFNADAGPIHFVRVPCRVLVVNSGSVARSVGIGGAVALCGIVVGYWLGRVVQQISTKALDKQDKINKTTDQFERVRKNGEVAKS